MEPLVSNISSCDMLGARVEWTLPTSLDAHIAAGHFDLTGFNVLLEERVVSQRLEPSCRKVSNIMELYQTLTLALCSLICSGRFFLI